MLDKLKTISGKESTEIKESENEKIRTEIIAHFQELRELVSNPRKLNKWLSYLEKRKEQKSATIVRIPKFRVGDIIQHVPLEKWDSTKKITSVDEHGYKFNLSHLGDTVGGGAISFAFEDEYELVKQQPTEWSEENFPKDIEKDVIQFCFDKGINITPHQAKEIATHYLMVGHNKGYVEGRKNAHISAKELGLPSSMDFKQEWSEEDERIMDNCIEYIKASCLDANDLYECIDWLKSLRNRPKSLDNWKPSKEQMTNLLKSRRKIKNRRRECPYK